MACDENLLSALAARRAKALFPALALLLLAAQGAASPVKACLARPVTFSDLFAADVIVRATAVRYVASAVEFKVEEVLRGAAAPASIALSGSLVDWDDFNETPVPYKLVRSGGRHGNCYANTYKQGAQFLLFLKKTAGGYTSDISPLGPSNEQLHSEIDPWLLWVKVRVNPCGKLHAHDEYYEQVREGKLPEFTRGRPPKDLVYRVGKCYLQKYEAQAGPDDQYVKYIKKWVEAYERLEEQR